MPFMDTNEGVIQRLIAYWSQHEMVCKQIKDAFGSTSILRTMLEKYSNQADKKDFQNMDVTFVASLQLTLCEAFQAKVTV